MIANPLLLRILAPLAVLLMLAPPAFAQASPHDVLGSSAVAPHGAVWQSWATTSSLAYPSGGSGYDDPGLPYGYPNHDTFGYTVESVNESRWIDFSTDNLTNRANVLVDMGEFNRMHMTDLSDNYWADVVFDARLRMWSDGDGHFEPNNSYVEPTPSSGAGGPVSAAPTPMCASAADGSSPPCIGPDDPCPQGDFPIMDVYAGTTLEPTSLDVFLRTVYGGNMTNCVGTSASEVHAFSILPDPAHPGEASGRFHIPKTLMGTGSAPAKECFVRLTFVPRDLALPHVAPGHDDTQDGFSINITSVMVQLVAPPLIINHGYAAGFNPSTEVLQNQWHLKLNIGEAMRQNFGQDPWAWATGSSMEGGIYLNSYDRKQDFRVSAAELATKANTQFNAHWTGKLWMQGQSMGGLVTRYYIEQLGGAARVEKLVQTATPNTGSFEPLILNLLMHNFYAQNDASPNTRLGIFIPPLPCPFPTAWVGWKPWWTAPPGNVFTWHCGFSPGRSRMADFELRPAGSKNPILHDMNAAYFPLRASGALPPYFSVRAGLDITPGFDEAVTFASASLNGAIPHRTIKSIHEETPSQPQSAVYFSRFFGDLNIDNAYPKWCMPHVTRVPHTFSPPFNAGDVVDSNAGPDYEGNATENMTLELFNWTKGVIPFDNGTISPPPNSTNVSEATLHDNAHVAFVVDATGPARIVVRTAFEYPALRISLLGPGGAGGTMPRAAYRESMDGYTRLQEFMLAAPMPGEYRLAIGPTAYATPYVVQGSWPSAHALNLATDKPSYALGEPVSLRASLAGVTPDVKAIVIAHVPGANGYEDLPMNGTNGAYEGTWSGASEDGFYSVYVTVEGSSKSGPFARNLSMDVLVAGKRASDPIGPDQSAGGPLVTTPPADTTPSGATTPTTTTTPTPASASPAPTNPTPGVGAFALLAVALVVALARRRRP